MKETPVADMTIVFAAQNAANDAYDLRGSADPEVRKLANALYELAQAVEKLAE